MKFFSKSVIAVAIIGVLFSGSMNVTKAAEAMVQTTDGSNVFLSIHGQDESIKSYDLDDIDKLNGEAGTNAASINIIRGDLTAEANSRVSYDNAQNQNISNNKTAIENNSLRITQADNHLQSVDNQVQTLKIDHIQDRQELAKHDAAIKTLDAENTRQEAYIQSVNNAVTKEATDRKAADTLLQTQVNNKVDTTTYNDDRKAQNDAHQQLVQRVTLDEQYDGAAISQNRKNIETITARQQGHDLEQANRDRTANQHPVMNNGKDGVDGKNGATGAVGKNGLNGSDGKDGKDGKDGINGKNGANGRNGITTTITKNEVDTATQTKVAANSTAISANTRRTADVAKDLQDAKQFFLRQQADSNAQFKNLKEEVDNNKKEARAGVASAVAIASMPQVEAGQKFMFSTGVGSFKDEQALSVGASFHAGNRTVIKAGISDSTSNDFAMGAGIGIGF